jgi:predicted Rdx family selenoprotein
LREAGFDAEATPGEHSQFDIRADGKLVFSKQEIGRFPEEGEVLASLTAA